MHFSVAVMLCDMPVQLTSVPLNSKGQSQLVTFAEGRLVRIFRSTFFLKQLGLVALLTIIWHCYFMSTKHRLVHNKNKCHIVIAVLRGAIRTFFIFDLEK